MLVSLENSQFFGAAEVAELRSLGLWQDSNTTPAKLAFAALLLAPVMQIVVRDDATSTAEFQAMQEYLQKIERDFALASHSDMESIGTDMGLLPMLRGTWDTNMFQRALSLLAAVMSRLSEREADDVRNAISKAALAAVRAGSPHMISFHMVDDKERAMVQDLIHRLKLERSTEGLNLLSKART
ncbi:MAG: hypothetical protein Q8922_12655 [Bacteroidota bacterium]|nr:hypothetical protein [Bacteroidota bacterium]MDP4233051.1 hypothetical protein [Bacteroidota bacterium]MDP4241804.1 hypothetical protein [Bacteroidota bacterium]MDP4288775.1 hypothetical protein [Bacteroidota bacterium]